MGQQLGKKGIKTFLSGSDNDKRGEKQWFSILV